MKRMRLFVGAMLALVTIVIVAQNTAEVETTLLFVDVSMPRAALLFITLAVGFGIGVLTAGRLVKRAKPEK